MKKLIYITALIVSLMVVSCTKPKGYGDIDILISYSANGNPLITDSLCYVNEAGERYMVKEVQWFISKIIIKSEQGDEYTLGHREVSTALQSPQDQVFYIDTNLPENQTLEISSIPCQRYVSLQFTFGLDQEYNQTGFFQNPPENDMFWPAPLGGGYHYMKLNGKYQNEYGELAPLNIHLGIGQNEDLTEFYQNHFTVELPIDLDLTENGVNEIRLNMNIDNWFRSPHIYEFQHFGSAIMQNQEAQQLLKENGHDVFETTPNNQPMDKIVGTIKNICGKAAPKPNFYTKDNMERLLSDLITPKSRRS